MGFIHETAKIIDSEYDDVSLYRNVFVKSSELNNNVSIGDDTTIERCIINKNVSINRRSYFNDSVIGSYTYFGINTIVNWAKIGKYCSVSRNVDIGGFDHNYKKVTTMSEERFTQLHRKANGCIIKDKEREYCEIGNDVWIAAGVQILHKVKIGDGAVIGAGAVVTKDVPPYAIVAGVPAKIIKYRCSENQIERLLKIKWWDWPESVIENNFQYFIDNDISDEIIKKMEKIKESL